MDTCVGQQKDPIPASQVDIIKDKATVAGSELYGGGGVEKLENTTREHSEKGRTMIIIDA